MFFLPRVSTMILAAALVASPAFATSNHSVPTNGHAHTSLTHRAGKAVRGHLRRASKPVGQRGIAPERATEIQSALIHENYMTGAPTGQWDAQTEAAMQKFQADHGWQTKLTPDSRALIKLGLGPNGSTGSTASAPATTYRAASTGSAETAEPGTLASVHSLSQ
jgi:hypothetical protein